MSRPPAGGRARRTLAALILVPLLELVLLLVVASHLGAGPVLAVVAVSGLLGLWLVRLGTPRAWQTVRELTGRGPTPQHHLSRQARGSHPISTPTGGLRAVGVDLTEDVLFLVAAILIAWPGLVTTLVGLVLILPPVRRAAARRVQARTERAATARLNRAVAVRRERLVGGEVLRGRTGPPPEERPDRFLP